MSGLSRRQFVAAAAGAAMAPYVVSPTALGRTRGRKAASERITLGFIGMGVMNRDHLNRFLGDGDAQVLAVCDVDTTRREAAKKTVEERYSKDTGAASGWKGCGAYNDYRELLARDDIDAVVIGTPDHWHANMVIDACRADKDIYCEKPLSLTLHEAKRMIDAVRKYDKVFQTGSQQRTEYGGMFRKACEYVRSGRIGQVMTVHVGVGESSIWCDLPEEAAEPGLDWDRWLGPAPVRPYNSILSPRGVHGHYPMWRRYREYSGGTLTDMGAHHFDIAQWGLGMDTSGPIKVVPPTDKGAKHGARLVYANGGGGVEVFHGGPDGTTFTGTRGVIAVNRDRLNSVPEGILKEELKESDTHLPTAKDHHADWIDCIRTRRRPICDIEVGARTIACCHLVNLAYWHGRTLTWDPEAWEFPGDREANGWRDYQRRSGYELPAV